MAQYFCTIRETQGPFILSNLAAFPQSMASSFLPNNAFPLPAPLTPTLVALGLDSKTAATVSKVYTSTALSLKGTFETEYIRACNVFVSTSDDLGHSSKELRSKLLTVATTRYMQALSQWMEGTIERAEASLLRRKKGTQHPRERTVQAAVALFSEPSRKDNPKPACKQESVPASVSTMPLHPLNARLTHRLSRNLAHFLPPAHRMHSLTPTLLQFDQSPSPL